MTVMEFINAHREDMEPCECVILPDGSVEEPQPSHIKKLEEISGEDKLTLNSRMEKNMERTAARPQPAWGAVTLTLSLENLTGWSILQPLAIPMGGVKPLLAVPADK